MLLSLPQLLAFWRHMKFTKKNIFFAKIQQVHTAYHLYPPKAQKIFKFSNLQQTRTLLLTHFVSHLVDSFLELLTHFLSKVVYCFFCHQKVTEIKKFFFFTKKKKQYLCGLRIENLVPNHDDQFASIPYASRQQISHKNHAPSFSEQHAS